jgi:hypothetical protein
MIKHKTYNRTHIKKDKTKHEITQTRKKITTHTTKTTITKNEKQNVGLQSTLSGIFTERP